MPRRSSPSVSLVVLNWNGKAHLEPCLESLLGLDYDPNRLEVILCDNGSSDGSADYVQLRYPRVKLIALECNHGFAEGNNLGAAAAEGEWLGFLNNDVWVERGWLNDVLAALDEHPRAVCLASRIKNWDGSSLDFIGGGVNYQGHGFQVDHGEHSSDRDIERRVLFACGGAMLIRRSVFEELGGFDPDYFAYFEDVDLGWRLNLLGREVWYTPRATVFHRHHGTASSLPAHKLRVLYERNALFTIYKCFEDQNLDRILSTALLLLNERALRLAQHDPREFRIQQRERPPNSAVDGGQQQSLPKRAQRVFRDEGATTALIKAVKLGRWSAKTAMAKASLAIARCMRPDLAPHTDSDHVRWPNITASHFQAVSEFAHMLDRLSIKRTWLQQRRRVSDRDLVPLFEDPFFANYADERYLDFYHWITGVQGLYDLFGAISD